MIGLLDTVDAFDEPTHGRDRELVVAVVALGLPEGAAAGTRIGRPRRRRRLVRSACRLAALADRRPLSWADVVDLATGQGVDDLTAIAALLDDGVTVELRLPRAEAEALATADPITFAVGTTTDPDTVLVDLDTVGAARLAPLLLRSWKEGTTPC